MLKASGRAVHDLDNAYSFMDCLEQNDTRLEALPTAGSKGMKCIRLPCLSRFVL